MAAVAFGTTKLSRAIALLLVVGYIVQLLVPTSRQYLALVAGRFIPCVWNVFTAGLLEVHAAQLIFSVVGILLLAKSIEPVWGSKEFLKFLAIVNLGTGLSTLVVIYVAYFVSTFRERAGKVLYQEVAGFHGVIAACLVAVKQLLPDTEVTLLRVIRFHAKHLASWYVLTTVVLSAALGTTLHLVPFVLSGSFIAWFYLRFLQVKSGLNLRGDPSNDFSFASFFPAFMQSPVNRVTGVFSRASVEDPASTASFVLQGKPLPGSDSSDAARRRERGARVLEERLKGSGASPSKDGDIEAPPVSQDAPTNGADGSN